MNAKVSTFFSRLRSTTVPLVALLSLVGCVTTGAQNSSGLAPQTLDPSQRGPAGGVGIEGQDIISMTDQMLRDMMSDEQLAGKKPAPRIIVDAEYFVNESSQPINKSIITDRLRVGLNRAARGKMVFVGRNYAGMVQQERDLKRQGVTDIGTTGLAKAQAGADLRMAGRITSIDQRNVRSGVMQRYNQITFEMVDLETGVIIWSGMYEFLRSAADDVVYR